MHLQTSLVVLINHCVLFIGLSVQNHVKSVLHVNLLYLYTYTFGYSQLYLRAVCVYETGKKTRSNLVPLFLKIWQKYRFFACSYGYCKQKVPVNLHEKSLICIVFELLYTWYALYVTMLILQVIDNHFKLHFVLSSR